MSLRWKMALAMAVVAVSATLSLGIASYRSTADKLLAEVDRSLLVPDQGRFIQGGDQLPDRNALSGFDARVITTDGTVLQSTLQFELDIDAPAAAVFNQPGASTIGTVTADDGDYRVRSVGVRGGAVQIIRSLDETNRVLAGVRNRTFLLVGGIGALAAVIGWWIAGQVTKPLRRLTVATESIAATGDLHVHVAEGDDEVGRLGEGFNKMTSALARSRDDQHRLVQDAGHELRTPLTSLRTNLDLLRRYPDLPPDQRAAIVDDLHAETSELTDLVNEVVSIASGALDREDKSVFDLTEIAAEVAERFGRRFGRPVNVESGPATTVRAQRDGVQRVLSCLLENACKFDTSGGPIDVEVADSAVTVADRGPGIADADADRIFERFFRAESSRAMPGSGLGLAIVHDIVTRNGGEVTVAKRDGGGTRFAVRFPSAELPPPLSPSS